MRRFMLAIVLSLVLGSIISAQAIRLPARLRLSPEAVVDASLYMARSIRADRVLWSPGGSLLAVVDDVDVLLFPVADWAAEPIRLRSAQPVVDLTFSRSGALLYVAQAGSITAWSVDTGASAERYVVDARRIAVSPDDSRLAVLTRQSTVDVISVADRSVVSMPVTPPAEGVAFSRDGRFVIVSDGLGGGKILDPVLRQSTVSMSPLAPQQAGLTVLRAVAVPAGQRSLVTQVAVGPVAFARRAVDDGAVEAEYALPAAFSRVYGWDVNPRSGLLVGAGIGRAPEQSAVVVWHYSDGFAIETLAHPGVRDVAISPDGTLIASVGGGALRLWAAGESSLDAAVLAGLSQVNVVAACSDLDVRPSAAPPIGGQTVSMVWSWYAATEAQVLDYLDAGIFALTLDGVVVRPWIFVSRVAPDAANGGDPTVYLYAPVGTLGLGTHWTTIDVTWARPISDGYAEYGPGTPNPSDGGSCSFTAQ